MIGLGSYAYFWRQSNRVSAPMSLIEVFEDCARQDVNLFQICDYEPLELMSDRDLNAVASAARDLGITIELGTKGLEPEHLSRFLTLAEKFDAKLVRSMLKGKGSTPSLAQADKWLDQALPDYERAGVTLALETYEQIATSDLVSLAERIESPNLGICLDPANVVARLESPEECVTLTSPHVKNVHVKDFTFARQDGWVGFTYSGAKMGEGLHDYAHLLQQVKPRARGINEIVEHWLPWQGNEHETEQQEREWTRATLEYLRSTNE